jgi:hypothetical protein
MGAGAASGSHARKQLIQHSTCRAPIDNVSQKTENHKRWILLTTMRPRWCKSLAALGEWMQSKASRKEALTRTYRPQSQTFDLLFNYESAIHFLLLNARKFQNCSQIICYKEVFLFVGTLRKKYVGVCVCEEFTGVEPVRIPSRWPDKGTQIFLGNSWGSFEIIFIQNLKSNDASIDLVWRRNAQFFVFNSLFVNFKCRVIIIGFCRL